MPIASDPYPTRLHQTRAPIPRREPTVYDPGDRQGPLDAAALERFEQDGFLVLENYLSRGTLRPFLDDLEVYARDPDLRQRQEVITEPDSGGIRSIFGVHRLSARVDALTRDPRLLDLAVQILGSDVYVHQSRLNRKPAFRGRGFDWHSDFETWHAEDGMPQMRCISISVSLTENAGLNGPLLLIPGSHQTFLPTLGATPEHYWETSLRRQKVGVPELDDLHRAARAGGVVPVSGGPGTVTVFDCNTLHASSDNLSPLPRANLFFVYNSVENRLRAPFAAPAPRPQWLAARDDVEPLQRTRTSQVA